MIRKSKKSGNFTTIPNEIFKSGMSIESVGLLCYLLSLPADWVVYKSQLMKTMSIGREKMDRMFSELNSAGYIQTNRIQLENGKFDWEHVVFDQPLYGKPAPAEPLPVKPLPAEPPPANQHLLNKTITKETKQKKLNKDDKTFGENAVFAEIKSDFLKWYKYLKKTEYYFTGKDGAAIKGIINKIKFLKSDADQTTIPDDFRFLLKNINDQWINENLSLTIINSKFNEIISKIKNGNNAKPNPTQSRKQFIDRIDQIINQQSGGGC